MHSFVTSLALLAQAPIANQPDLPFYQQGWFLWVIAIAVVILPFLVGSWLSRVWRMPEHSFRFGITLFALVAGIVICAVKWKDLRLGIDLSGGVILIYELDETQQAQINLGPGIDRIERYLEQENINAKVSGTDNNQIVVELAQPNEDTLKKVEEIVSEKVNLTQFTLKSLGSAGRRDDRTIVFQAERPAGEKVDLDELVSALNRRVNPGGQKEVVVRKFGERQVEIIIPRVEQAEIATIKDKISTSGMLEFRILANERQHAAEIALARQNPQARDVVQGGRVVAKWVKIAEDKFQGVEGMESRQTKSGETEVLVHIDPYDVDGSYLARAGSGYDETASPAVNFSFNTPGAIRFGQLTGDNLPDRISGSYSHLGIILDGRLYSAPRLISAITSQGQITGNFQQEEVDFIVEVLNAGHLPAALAKTPVSETNISPQLGEDTIRSGSISMIVSTIAILIFMAVYYRFAGLVANFTVLLNILLVVAFMILFKAAFTLAGLAGLVLSVGMAVDANVLIYERMREELQRGAALRMAIRNGFGRAMSTIIDSNLTTLLTGVVLYAIGTDQLKGFAITLILGLLLNLFTAVYVGRVIFDVAERRRWLTKLNMMRMFSETNFDFVRPTAYAITLSLIVIAIGLGAAFARGSQLLDIDFVGGTSVQTQLREPMHIGNVREIVEGAGSSNLAIEDVTVSAVGAEGQESTVFKIDSSIEEIPELQERLQKLFAGKLAVYEMSFTSPEAIATDDRTPPSSAPIISVPGASGTTQPEKPSDNATNEPGETTKTPTTEEPASDQSAPKEDANTANGNEETNKQPQADEKATDESNVNKQSSVFRRHGLAGLTAASLLLLQEESADSKVSDAKADAAQADENSKKGDEAKSADTEEKSDTAKGEQPDAKDKEKVKDPAKENDKAKATTPPVVGAPAFANPFAGGSKSTLHFEQKISRETLQLRLAETAARLGFHSGLFQIEDPEGGTSSRPFEEWTVSTTLAPDQLQQVLQAVDQELENTPIFRAANKIGGRVAGQTKIMAVYAILASMVMIVAYVWVRFQNIVFGLAAVVALVHDVLVTISAIAISYYVAPWLGWALVDPFKISLDVVAALLTIVGFSINDTIVIFDRIREIKGKSPEITKEMVNKAVNQTLGRTILTSGTVLMVTLILYIWGGQEIHAFAFAMLIGLISGTYSTVYIASPLVLWLRKPGGSRGHVRAHGERASVLGAR
jgi:SecD/SecF fusion protein